MIRCTNPSKQDMDSAWGSGEGSHQGSAHAFRPTFLILPPLSPTQDAAGPPGPLCADPAARLRLAGASVR